MLEEKTKEKLYAETPTLTKMVLNNGSKIFSLPAGRTGYFIRGMTIDLLVADEAGYIPETVWNAVIPMIAVSQKRRGFGFIVLLSTPFGKGGYFYQSFEDPDFKSFHISSEQCPRIPKEFLRKEKLRMSAVEYRQEYLGEFCDDSTQFFPTELIKKCMTIKDWDYKTDFKRGNRYYLGVDFARYGGDENALVIAESIGDKIRIVSVETTFRTSSTDTIGRIIEKEAMYNFKKIFVDDGGLGGPITDMLIEKLGRKVIGLNNASRGIKVQDIDKRVKLLKEDLYCNTLMLMENDLVEFINDMYLMKSMKSITFQYGVDKKKIHIFGLYAHICEALVRACWLTKEKGLSIYLY